MPLNFVTSQQPPDAAVQVPRFSRASFETHSHARVAVGQTGCNIVNELQCTRPGHQVTNGPSSFRGWRGVWARPLLSDTRGGGGGGQIAPPGILADPPTHPHQKIFPQEKMKFIKGARTWRSILGTQTFFWPLTPPPPRYSINQPLSKGLVWAPPPECDCLLHVPRFVWGAVLEQPGADAKIMGVPKKM